LSDDLMISREQAKHAKPWAPRALSGRRATDLTGATSGAADPASQQDAQLAELRNQALRQGFEQGYATGERAARDEAERLAELAQAAAAAIATIEETLADRLLELAIDIARQVIRGEVLINRDSLLSIVQEAIRTVPDGTLNGEVQLHPSDVELVRTRLHEELKLGVWRVVPHAGLEQGSVRISTRQCDVDATLPTRWLQAMQTLARSDAWKKPEPGGAGHAKP
jgi:flagellar assembly protein FliH